MMFRHTNLVGKAVHGFISQFIALERRVYLDIFLIS